MRIRRLCKQKIQSESGASLAAALLFFIVSAVVGSVILAAALSSAGRMKGIVSGDNQRYALESAKEVILDSMQYVEEAGQEPGDDLNAYGVYQNTSYIAKYKTDGTATAVYQDGYSTAATITDFVGLQKNWAECLYRDYWLQIKAAWENSSTGSFADIVLGKDGDGSGNGMQFITDSDFSWVPTGNEEQYKTITLKLYLNSANGDKDGKDKKTDAEKNAVTATISMQRDFSIKVTLQAAAQDSGSKDVYPLKDEFYLQPTIQMHYESTKSDLYQPSNANNTEIPGISEQYNDRKIVTTIYWQEAKEYWKDQGKTESTTSTGN